MPKLIPPVVAAGSMSSSAQPRIEIDRSLALRPWARADAPTVMAAYATPDIQHWHFRRFDTMHEAEASIDAGNDGWRSETQASWAIVRRRSDRVVGRVTIYPVLVDGYGEISYWVLPGDRGSGIATRAAVTATRWAHELGIHRIELEHSTDNAASGRVARRAGFVNEGLRRGANLHDDGWHDMQLYAHLATDPLPESISDRGAAS